MSSSILTITLMIEEALKQINAKEFYGRRAELEQDPEAFFEDVRSYLKDHTTYEPGDINYCIDTCLLFCNDLNDENSQKIIDAIMNLVKKSDVD